MRRFVALALTGAAFAPVAWADPPIDVPRPPPIQIPVGEDFYPGHYRGRVIELTPWAVTIKFEGYVQMNRIISYHPDGTVKVEQVYIQDNNQPPKDFVFHRRLLRGPYRGHAVYDLRVGDVVEVSCARFRGVEQCSEIEIYRRPGGKVPPVVGEEDAPAENRWSVRMNAEQAREENSVAALLRIGLGLVR